MKKTLDIIEIFYHNSYNDKKRRKNMRIKGLADNIGICPQTVRNYEKEGWIPPAVRSATGQRIYSVQDVLLIQQVVKERSQAKKRG